MKLFITAIILSIGFSGISQNWDKRYETAKYEYQNDMVETYTTDIHTPVGFTGENFDNVEDGCIEFLGIFRIDHMENNNSIRFYHKSNVDTHLIMEIIKEALGVITLTEGKMKPYLFE
jgi:hypothetical protein